MDRRRFLVASGVGSATLMSGCVTTQGAMQGPGLGDILQGIAGAVGGAAGRNASGGRARLGYEGNMQAAAAYAQFYEAMAQSGDPSRISLPGANLQTHVAALQRHLDALPPTLSDRQMADLWPQLSPLVERLSRTRTATPSVPGTPSTPGTRPAAARLSGVFPSQSDWNLDRDWYFSNEPRVVRTPRYQDILHMPRIKLMPGQTARMLLRGHCADKTLPAFGSGHLLTLRPASQFLANDRWGRLQMAVLDHLAAHPQALSWADQQLLLWGLQGKEANGSPYYLQALLQRPDLLQILEQASPGALAQIRQAQMMDELQKHLQQMLRQNLPPEVARFMGNANIVGLLSDPSQAGAFIEQELARMAQAAPAPASQNIRPEAAYTTLAPGVHAHAIGSGRLNATVTMTNMSDQPFEFAPSQWVAESKTNTQRGMFINVALARVWDHAKAGHQTWDEIDTAASLVSVSQRMGRLALGAAGLRPGTPGFDRLAQAMRFIHQRHLEPLLRNPLARQAIDFVPILGNIKSAFDVLDASAAPHERILALYGTIPGAGTLVKIAGGAGRAAQAARWALNSSGGRFAVSLGERTEVLRQLNDVAKLAEEHLSQADSSLWAETHAAMAPLLRPVLR